MIVSHKYKFIFLKTRKTAGSSLEAFLSSRCGPGDILTPIYPPMEEHLPRNANGLWNPLPELLANRGRLFRTTLRYFRNRDRFYNHIPARLARWRLQKSVWEDYFKFCVERNPWDKTISHYSMRKFAYGDTFSLDRYLKNKDFVVDHSIYTDAAGAIQVDRIIRFEHLAEELGEVFAMLGIHYDGDLGVRSKANFRKNRQPYQELYSNAQREIIRQVFAWEIEQFGYTF